MEDLSKWIVEMDVAEIDIAGLLARSGKYRAVVVPLGANHLQASVDQHGI